MTSWPAHNLSVVPLSRVERKRLFCFYILTSPSLFHFRGHWMIGRPCDRSLILTNTGVFGLDPRTVECVKVFLCYLFNLLFDKDQVLRSDLVPMDLLPGKGRYCWVLVKDIYDTVKAFLRQRSRSASITAWKIQPQRYNLLLFNIYNYIS